MNTTRREVAIQYRRKRVITGLCITAWHGKEWAGNVVLITTPDRLLLNDLIVPKPYRQQGIGTRLVQLALEVATKRKRGVYLWAVPESQHRKRDLMRFYLRLGFTRVAVNSSWLVWE